MRLLYRAASYERGLSTAHTTTSQNPPEGKREPYTSEELWEYFHGLCLDMHKCIPVEHEKLRKMLGMTLDYRPRSVEKIVDRNGLDLMGKLLKYMRRVLDESRNDNVRSKHFNAILEIAIFLINTHSNDQEFVWEECQDWMRVWHRADRLDLVIRLLQVCKYVNGDFKNFIYRQKSVKGFVNATCDKLYSRRNDRASLSLIFKAHMVSLSMHNEVPASELVSVIRCCIDNDASDIAIDLCKILLTADCLRDKKQEIENELLRAYNTLGYWKEASSLLIQMQSADLETVKIVINTCTQSKDTAALTYAEELFLDYWDRKKATSNVVSSHSVLRILKPLLDCYMAYSKHVKAFHMLSTFSPMLLIDDPLVLDFHSNGSLHPEGYANCLQLPNNHLNIHILYLQLLIALIYHTCMSGKLSLWKLYVPIQPKIQLLPLINVFQIQ
jgi:hypothetical protein